MSLMYSIAMVYTYVHVGTNAFDVFNSDGIYVCTCGYQCLCCIYTEVLAHAWLHVFAGIVVRVEV